MRRAAVRLLRPSSREIEPRRARGGAAAAPPLPESFFSRRRAERSRRDAKTAFGLKKPSAPRGPESSPRRRHGHAGSPRRLCRAGEPRDGRKKKSRRNPRAVAATTPARPQASFISTPLRRDAQNLVMAGKLGTKAGVCARPPCRSVDLDALVKNEESIAGEYSGHRPVAASAYRGRAGDGGLPSKRTTPARRRNDRTRSRVSPNDVAAQVLDPPLPRLLRARHRRRAGAKRPDARVGGARARPNRGRGDPRVGARGVRLPRGVSADGS